MSPSKRKKGREGPRDLRHRRVVFSAGSSLLKSPSSTIARGAVSGSTTHLLLFSYHGSCCPGERSGLTVDLCRESDGDVPHVLDGSFSLDRQRVVSVYSCEAKLNYVELEKIMMTSVISHSLKRNANVGDL